MTSIQRIESVEEILKNTGRLRRTELVNRLMKEGDMSKQVAYNAIDEAERSGKVKREERYKGKELKAFYTVNFDIEKDEKELYENMKKRLKEFDNRFHFIKDKFSRLTLDEKAAGIESCDMLHLFLYAAVHALWINFAQTNEWKKLLDDVNSRKISINDLMRTCTMEEGRHIARHITESKISAIDIVFNQQIDYLNGIARDYRRIS